MDLIKFIVFTIFIVGALSNVVPQKEFEFIDNHTYVGVTDGIEGSYDGKQTRIYGGKLARRNQFPYQVGLFTLEHESSRIGSWCGGMLIAREWVLTAAHCIVDKNGINVAKLTYVYLGAYDIRNYYEEGQLRYKVYGRNIIKHYNYDSLSSSNDIALVKLPIQVKLNEYIQLIDLPKSSDDESTFIGQTIVSSGWGHLGKQRASNLLFYMTSKVVPGSQCQGLFRYYSFNEKRQVCIYSHGRSTCEGDSGGLHVAIRADGSKVAIGITSYGAINCVDDSPEIATRISYYLNWIHYYTGITIEN